MNQINLVINDGILHDVIIPRGTDIIVKAYKYGDGCNDDEDGDGNPCDIETWESQPVDDPHQNVSDLLCECITALIDLSIGYPQTELTRPIAQIVNDSKEALKAIGVDTEELGDVE